MSHWGTPPQPGLIGESSGRQNIPIISTFQPDTCNLPSHTDYTCVPCYVEISCCHLLFHSDTPQKVHQWSSAIPENSPFPYAPWNIYQHESNKKDHSIYIYVYIYIYIYKYLLVNIEHYFSIDIPAALVSLCKISPFLENVVHICQEVACDAGAGWWRWWIFTWKNEDSLW